MDQKEDDKKEEKLDSASPIREIVKRNASDEKEEEEEEEEEGANIHVHNIADDTPSQHENKIPDQEEVGAVASHYIPDDKADDDDDSDSEYEALKISEDDDDSESKYVFQDSEREIGIRIDELLQVDKNRPSYLANRIDELMQKNETIGEKTPNLRIRFDELLELQHKGGVHHLDARLEELIRSHKISTSDEEGATCSLRVDDSASEQKINKSDEEGATCSLRVDDSASEQKEETQHQGDAVRSEDITSSTTCSHRCLRLVLNKRDSENVRTWRLKDSLFSDAGCNEENDKVRAEHFSKLRHFTNGQAVDSSGRAIDIGSKYMVSLLDMVELVYYGYSSRTEKNGFSLDSTGEHLENAIYHEFISKLGLKKNYPIELFVHYLTCQDPKCVAGAAFTIDEQFFTEIKEWVNKQQFQYTPFVPGQANFQNNRDWVYAIKDKMTECIKHPEKKDIEQGIEKLIHDICKAIKSSGDWSNLIVERGGSTKEGTKCYFPDEFDFVLKLYGNDPFYCGHGNDGQHPICMECGQSMYQSLMKLLNNKSFEVPWQLSGLRIESDRYFKLYIWWHGKYFKHMLINIDLVPVMYLDKTESISLQSKFSVCAPARVRIVLPCTGGEQNIDTAELEYNVIEKLPENMKNGYILAKAIRTCIVLEGMVETVNINICKIIRTYMLKTCLLYISQSKESNSHSDVFWAMCIYVKLLIFLYNCKMPNYFNPSEDLVKKFPVIHSIEPIAMVAIVLDVLDSAKEESVQFLHADFPCLVKEVVGILKNKHTTFFSAEKLSQIKGALKNSVSLPLEGVE